ncbi:MAG: hypothetical protein MSS69_08730 [Spirochaetales bacterium]|nr:hypothetical protein [Spirochaetales bacterium]
MKKVIIFCLMLISISLLFAVNSSNTITLKEEIGYNGYNNMGSYSTGFNEYNVNSISSNTVFGNIIKIMPSENVGVAISTGLGYQKDIYDYNRFASIPSNINGKAAVGMVYCPIDDFYVSLSGGLRTTYLLSKSNWISQVGGEVSLEYNFDFGLNLSMSAAYWYNTNYRSIVCGVGLGYCFGGER